MTISRLMRTFIFGTVVSCNNTFVIANELLSPIDLVPPDSAMVVEIPHLEQTWTAMNSSPFMHRLRVFPLFQTLFEGEEIQKWKRIEDRVFKKTGQSFSTLTLSLCSKSLVLALRLPTDGPPQGLVITQSKDKSAIPMFIKTWQQYESETVMTAKSHHGVTYFQRNKKSAPKQVLYFTTVDDYLAMSDHESCIQAVIDRSFKTPQSAQNRSTELAFEMISLSQSRTRLDCDADLFLHINARPWDDAIEEFSRYLGLSIRMTEVWRQIRSISSSLRFQKGFVSEIVVELDQPQQSSEWRQIVSTASGESQWPALIPNDALAVFGGQIELTPIVRFIEKHMPEADLLKFRKTRRSAQSLLGGVELVDVVLPPLAKKFSGFLVACTESPAKNSRIDGILRCSFDPSQDSRIACGVARASDTFLNLHAAKLSETCPNIVTVRREQTNSSQLEWLSEPADFPSAFGIQGPDFIIAGSEDSLRQSLNTDQHRDGNEHRSFQSRKRFPETNQFLWLDTMKIRDLFKVKQSEIVDLFSPGSYEEMHQIVDFVKALASKLELIDSLFIGCRIDLETLRLIVHGEMIDE